MDERVLKAVESNYVRVGPELIEPLLDFLMTARRTGSGDIDKIMIMIVVGLRTLAHPAFKLRDPEDILRDEPLIPTLGTNARSLASALPIARETVRRKVAELIEAGWLVRSRGQLHYTTEAGRQLIPVRARIVQLAVKNFEAISRLEKSLPEG